MLTTAMRPVRCKAIGCQNMLVRRTINHRACSVECAKVLVDIKNAKEAARMAKVERASIKARKEKIKTRSEWLKDAQVAVNRYCRLRDISAGYGCISCGARPDAGFGGTMDAGHFRSVGSAPHMRYYTTQIRAQCVKCNRYRGGNAVEMRKGLVERIGVERVEQIEHMEFLAKFDIDYLKRLKTIYAKKARRLEKRCT